MKWKLNYSNFNPDEGTSFVIISTELGTFDGACKLHDEDKDIQSEFFGCRIAEMRAVSKYMQKRIQLLKQKISTFENLIDNLEQLNNYDKNSVEARFVRKQYYILKERLEKWTKNLDTLKETIYNSMKNYRQDHENFYKKVEKHKQKSIEDIK